MAPAANPLKLLPLPSFHQLQESRVLQPTPTPTKKRRHSMLFKPSFRFTISHNRHQRRRSSVAIDPMSNTSTAQLPTPPASPPFTEPLRTMPLTLPWPFGKPCKQSSRRGRDLGSVSSSIRPTTPLPSPTGSASSFEMHPGTLVDFTSPTLECNEEGEEVWESPVDEIEGDGHRDESISEEVERNSIASTSPCPSLSLSTWKTSHPPSLPDAQRTPRLPNIDYKAAKLLRRTHSEEQRDLIHRESYTTSLAAQHAHPQSLTPTSASRESRRKASLSSTSSVSVDEYVDSLRAGSPEVGGAQEKKRGWWREGGRERNAPLPIFVDEGEGVGSSWFLVEDDGILDSCMRG